jgi:hypothetical protein
MTAKLGRPAAQEALKVLSCPEEKGGIEGWDEKVYNDIRLPRNCRRSRLPSWRPSHHREDEGSAEQARACTPPLTTFFTRRKICKPNVSLVYQFFGRHCGRGSGERKFQRPPPGFFAFEFFDPNPRPEVEDNRSMRHFVILYGERPPIIAAARGCRTAPVARPARPCAV